MATLNRIVHLMQTPRAPFVTALLLSLALVGGGLLLANLLNLAACPLCILQRMLYLTLALISAVGLLLFMHRQSRMVAAVLMSVCAATGAFIAGYQTYLQRFAQEVQCSGAATWWEQLVDWAGEHLPLLFYASGLCSDPGWKFLALSIAEWSLLAFSFMTLYSLYALLRSRQS